MKKRPNLKIVFTLLGAVLLIGLDQLFKWLVLSNMQQFDSIPLISGVLNLTYLQNKGAAFSMLSGNTVFLILLTSLIILIALYLILFKKVKRTGMLVALSMIIAGGAGNLIDRIFRGFVVDYIDLKFWPMQNFAIFNFADCLVVVGVILLVLFVLLGDRKKSNKDLTGAQP